jgi:hypothetical protein
LIDPELPLPAIKKVVNRSDLTGGVASATLFVRATWHRVAEATPPVGFTFSFSTPFFAVPFRFATFFNLRSYYPMAANLETFS